MIILFGKDFEYSNPYTMFFKVMCVFSIKVMCMLSIKVMCMFSMFSINSGSELKALHGPCRADGGETLFSNLAVVYRITSQG